MKALYEKYLSGKAAAEERETLLCHLRDDEQLGAWLRADIEYAEGGMPEPIRERILRNVYGEQPSENHPPFRLTSSQRWLAAAVTVIIALFSTGMGEHSHVTLPDGTVLTLNALTTVRYNTQGDKRHALVDGEAFFEVARDEEHPFIVQAAEVDITCLGTAFNVRNYADEKNVSVVLSEGKVRVKAKDADLTMEPGSRVLMDRRTLALSKHTVNASDYTAWLSGEVKYNNQTLEEIATELSRNYNISMVITSEELKQERFTGYLGRASLRNILDVMCLAANMNYHIADDTVVYVYARK